VISLDLEPQQHRRRLRLGIGITATALVALAFALRLAALSEPLGIDQGLWASFARGLARGQTMYVDIWDQKPPGIFLTYLAGLAAFGWNTRAVVWLDWIASIVTTAALFGTANRLAGRTAGSLAAVLYALLTMPAALYGYGGFLERGVNETFISMLAAIGAYGVARFATGERALAALSAAGLAAGATVVYKPNAGNYAVALAGFLLLLPRDARGRRRAGRRELFVFWASAAVLPAAMVAWLWTQGLVREAWIAAIDYNLGYVSSGPAGSRHWLDYAHAIWLRLKTDPLWAAGGLASLAVLVNLRRRRVDALAALAVLWGAAAAIAIYANGAWLFNSYFIAALPPLALLAAWLFDAGARRSGLGRALSLLAAAVIVVLGGMRGDVIRVVSSARADLAALLDRVDRPHYLETFGGYANDRGYSARANAELAAYLRAHTSVDDRIYVFGISGAEAYFDADRLTAGRFLRVNFFIPGDYPDPRFRIDAVVEGLARARPAALVFERLHSTSPMAKISDALPGRPDVQRLLTGYRLDAQIEDFAVYRRLD
jgi:hypothetical protein